ncbi:GNAT family N-acetyltransferase [Flavivirga aquimarina]|uniref:GNAT family N-acetyltransferase n=1 Tax=Flavivirga aquimarina TaxID=2027862 RepID=A0ABT8WBL4_9FLAO|nr:GNAT family N-acetyltransferase [Flavivirga aquimarina]MDO5970515.1 GNAT family N-acetyltransferase [Flavivirga aquimarina]
MYSIKEVNDQLLIPLEPCHTNLIYKYLNHEKISHTYPISLPYTHRDAQNYVEHEIRCRQYGTRFSFAIQFKYRFAGVCALYDIDKSLGEAKLYYWVAVEFWNRGIATKALKKLMLFAKNELKIKSLRTGVLKRNIASRRVLEKNGFTLQNTLVNITEYHAKFIGEQFLEMEVNL